jgi:hypothetical protein
MPSTYTYSLSKHGPTSVAYFVFDPLATDLHSGSGPIAVKQQQQRWWRPDWNYPECQRGSLW